MSEAVMDASPIDGKPDTVEEEDYITIATASLNLHSTADDVLNIEGLAAGVSGKSVIITGGNSGLGLETAKILAGCGAHILISCRNEHNGAQAINQIKSIHPNAQVDFFLLDLASFDSIRKAVNSFLQSEKPLHILINNAAVMACPLDYTKDGYEMQIGVNHLGHFLLTGLLLPAMIKSATSENPGRIITISCSTHLVYTPSEGILFTPAHILKPLQSYKKWEQYGQTKLANILFSQSLQYKCNQKSLPILSLSLSPGIIPATNLLRYNNIFESIISNIKEMWGKYNNFYKLIALPKSLSQGVATIIRCVLTRVEPGGYYEDCQISERIHEIAKENEEKEKESIREKLWIESEKMVDLRYP